MNKEDRTEFGKIMWALAEECGGTLSKENMEMRFRSLSEFSIDQVKAACRWLFDNREVTFPAVPRTKEIRDAIKTVSGDPNPKTIANIECDKVFSKLKRFGRDALPLFHDEKTKYLMTSRWTFDQLGRMKEEDLKWFRRDFVEAYQDMGGDLPLLIGDKKTNVVAMDNIKILALATGSVKKIETV